ncbi:MAG: ABC transporter permease subunit, partial [Rickettsia endosymbiont of Ixodes persulcatus]|nr:ABC transporter permease subunit [Rickettsia endosymbiont of Ixodes persulcatus]
ICLCLGYPFAYILARLKSKYKSLLLFLVIIPFWTSSLIRTYAIISILKAKGLLNTILLSLGIIHQPLSILYTGTAVMIGLVYSLLPFMILPLYANIEKLDIQFIDAARDLGANTVIIFMRVILPLTLPGIVGGIILVFLPAMSMFYIPDILGGAKSLLVGNLIQNEFLSAHNWPLGSAVSMVLTLSMGLLLLVYRRVNKIGQQYESIGEV